MEAAQRSNEAEHGMLRFLRKQVVSKFSQLPEEVQTGPKEVLKYMEEALERISRRKSLTETL